MKGSRGSGSRGGSDKYGVVAKRQRMTVEVDKLPRPVSAFFVFMEDFRKQYKEKHPNNKSVAAEKAPYEARARQRNKQRNKDIEAYNKILAEASTEEDDDDEDDDDDESGEEEDDDEY